MAGQIEASQPSSTVECECVSVCLCLCERCLRLVPNLSGGKDVLFALCPYKSYKASFGIQEFSFVQIQVFSATVL